MPSGIYVWKLNGVPKYVGKGVDVHQRMYKNHGDNKALSRAILKYGFDAFEKEVICYCEPNELNQLEEYYIRQLHTHRSEHGYNLTWGGDGAGSGQDHPLFGLTGERHPSWGMKRSKETIAKMSESHKGNTLTLEIRQKIAEAFKGKGNPMFGIKQERATSKYYGVSRTGRKYRALITVNKKLIHIGYFETELDAALAYNGYVVQNSLNDYPLNDL